MLGVQERCLVDGGELNLAPDLGKLSTLCCQSRKVGMVSLLLSWILQTWESCVVSIASSIMETWESCQIRGVNCWKLGKDV